MQTLKPIYDRDVYSAPVAKEIYFTLYEAIFAPLFQIMEGDKTLENAGSRYLVQALRSGELQYVDGFFIGRLTSNLSKELRGIGAVYNKVKKAYKLEIGNLPQDILMAISEGNVLAKGKLKKVEDFLTAVEGRSIKSKDLTPFLGDTLEKLEEQFKSTTQKITGKVIEIPLRDDIKSQLKSTYLENLDLYIQKWYDEQILRLRKKVSENVQQGFRAENLIKDIQAEKKVSYNKAKFLAKQETSLMVSKYRQVRYEDAGVTKYMWSTSKDVRVRHDHRDLQGRIFRFDQPPITDKNTGARNNPGEDFNCRCVAIPILSNAETLEFNYAEK